MHLKAIFKTEIIKLFRRSNLLFIFLAIYLLITPVGRAYDAMREKVLTDPVELLLVLSESMAIFGMLLMAAFMVNNTGAEFQEGSYRRSIASGMKKTEFFSGKILLILFIGLCLIAGKICLYVIFGITMFRFPSGDLFWSLIHPQLIRFYSAMVFAGLFGFSFISVFKNRSVGLVFFPLWMLTEVFIFGFSLSEKTALNHNLFPGIAAWQIQSSSPPEQSVFIVFLGYLMLFIASSYFSIMLREVRK